MKRATVAAGVGTLAAFAVFAWVLDSPPPSVSIETEKPDLAPLPDVDVDLPRTAVTLGEIFGVNEGLTLPHHALSGRMTPSDTFILQGRRSLLDELGAPWVRLNSHGFPALNHLAMRDGDGVDWRPADDYFASPALDGVELLVVIGPWPGTRTGKYTDRYVPQDMDAYTAWVSAVVERYGEHVAAWEIDNEPDLHNSATPKGGEAQRDFQNPQEYAQVLLATAEAIRASDPDAVVLSGGLYRAMTPKGRAYYQELVAIDGVLDAIDAVSLHCYFGTSDMKPVHELFDVTRALAPDKPVWITETSVPSSTDKGASPEWQAEMVVRLHGTMLAQGADRVFWHTLFDAQDPRVDGPIGFRTNSLYDQTDGRVSPKPAAEVYARLTRRLAPLRVDEMVVGEGVLEFPTGMLVYEGIVLTPAWAVEVEDLATGEVLEPNEMTGAPAWIAR